jgi:hypothetical protein
LTKSPILVYPSLEKEFLLDTDASGFGLGAVLFQIGPDNKEHVIAYFSKAITKPEHQYCVTRRELLSVLAAVKQFHHYLYGVHFTVRTDHGALSWFTNFKNPEGQLARWLEVLGYYNFTIKHRAGIRHGNADGLSRRPCSDCKHCDQVEGKVDVNTPNKLQSVRAQRVATQPETDVEQNAISTNWLEGKTKEDLLEAQQEDTILKLSWLHQNSRPEWSAISHLGKLCKAYWAQWDRLTLVNDILYRKWLDTTTDEVTLQYVLPDKYKTSVLQLLHDDKLAGHLGIKRTIARVSHRFYWVGYTKYIDRWCKCCNECQLRKGPSHNTRGAMKTCIVGETLDRVALDL